MLTVVGPSPVVLNTVIQGRCRFLPYSIPKEYTYTGPLGNPPFGGFLSLLGKWDVARRIKKSDHKEGQEMESSFEDLGNIAQK